MSYQTVPLMFAACCTSVGSTAGVLRRRRSADRQRGGIGRKVGKLGRRRRVGRQFTAAVDDDHVVQRRGRRASGRAEDNTMTGTVIVAGDDTRRRDHRRRRAREIGLSACAGTGPATAGRLRVEQQAGRQPILHVIGAAARQLAEVGDGDPIERVVAGGESTDRLFADHQVRRVGDLAEVVGARGRTGGERNAVDRRRQSRRRCRRAAGGAGSRDAVDRTGRLGRLGHRVGAGPQRA